MLVKVLWKPLYQGLDFILPILLKKLINQSMYIKSKNKLVFFVKKNNPFVQLKISVTDE